jgi:hypothetical protein
MKEKFGIALIIAIVISAVTGMLLQAPIAQDVSYHLFTDSRTIGAVSNFWNVVSNIPFLLVGILGLYRLTIPGGLVILHEIKIAYALLFLGAALVALGSGYYHLWPDNRTLVWDRLPMTIAFMSLFVIIISEFISVRIGKGMLVPLLLAGITSVVYWHMSEGWGEGDLRFYALVQFTPMLVIPVILICFRSRYTGVAAYWWLLLAYIASKLFEHFDVGVYEALGFISGHSLKHIAAALGLYVLLASYRGRSYTALSADANSDR